MLQNRYKPAETEKNNVVWMTHIGKAMLMHF